jgi:DNA-binding LacI/PurR family transcriptional regulator
MTANRAMQELASRDVLSRSQRRGTFVGENIRKEESISLRTVHLLLPADYFRLEKPYFDRVVAGLHTEAPRDSIQFTFFPPQGELAFVREFVERLRPTGTLGGVVLFLSPPEVQAFFRDSGIPAVVSGSVYPEVGGLPWVDRDQRDIGRRLVEAALERGHRRIGVLMRERWGFGDNLMIDGIHEALSHARRTDGALVVRSLPSDPEMIGNALRPILSTKERPTALICRSRLSADAATRTAEALKLRVPEDLEIFLADYYPDPRKSCRYPHAHPAIEPEEHGAMVGRMLKSLARGERLDPDHHAISIRIQEPEGR